MTQPSGRTKPEAAMVAPEPPPPPPTDLSQRSDREQADLSFQLYRGVVDYAGQLKRKYDELVNWIKGEP